jgi:hypothetical protein
MFSNLIIFMNPVAVVQAVSLIFNFGWINAIALVVIIVGGGVIEIILVHFHDCHVWQKIIDCYFHTCDDCEFEPIAEADELERYVKKTWNMIRSSPKMAPLTRRFHAKIRAFYVCPKGLNWPTALKTYPLANGTSFVFLPWRLEKMSLAGKFHLLHEIGHATVVNSLIDMQIWCIVGHFCLLFLFVVFHREAGMLAMLVVLALTAMWTYYFLQQQRNREERCECAADTFALMHLAGRPDFLTTIDYIARDFHKRSENIPFWRYRAELLVQRAQILSRSGSDLSLRQEQCFNWLDEMRLPVPLWLSLLTFAGMFWLGATLRIKDWKELGALSLIWFLWPALWFYYYTFVRVTPTRTGQARRVALKFLQAHTPPDLPEGRQVKTVFDLV